MCLVSFHLCKINFILTYFHYVCIARARIRKQKVPFTEIVNDWQIYNNLFRPGNFIEDERNTYTRIMVITSPWIALKLRGTWGP